MLLISVHNDNYEELPKSGEVSNISVILNYKQYHFKLIVF